MGRKNRKSRYVAPHAVREVVPPVSQVVAPRVLTVPAQVLEALAQAGPLEGVPDLRGTRLLIGGLVAFFVLMAAVLAAGAVLQEDWSNARGNEAILVLLGLALFGLLGGGIWYLLRQFSRVGEGAMLRIDAQGMRWGDPASPQAVAWHEVCRARMGFHDVKTEFASSEAIVKRLVFQQAVRGGEPREIRLPLALTIDTGRVLRFRNRAALLRALLLHLATQPQPRLRFDAEVFIDSGIDPQTWEPMLAPRRWMWLSALGGLVPVLGVIFLSPLGEHIGWMVAAMVLAMVAGAGAMGWFMHQRYPGLQGVFEFETAPGATP
ncbi:hypothetical protein J2W34_002429 [Variovorax boronicumulans]|uniref:hypothetical protein n=1 Tax=Variovorax boronicumulans TaxID=436515 RepID=UPI002788330E|nr:hypothetical protein [Variovorax boronicumulans]MDQ0070644.1 hypothetical protein [Variovorax boronicumulans]